MVDGRCVPAATGRVNGVVRITWAGPPADAGEFEQSARRHLRPGGWFAEPREDANLSTTTLRRIWNTRS